MAEQFNYFTSQIKRYNTEDFLPYLKPEQIQKSAKERIFKEMCRGQIDYAVHGKYFIDSRFLENLIIAATNELTNNSTVSAALEYYDLCFPGDMNVIHNRTIYSNRVAVLTVILGKLTEVKFTSNFGCLTDIQFILKNHQKFI